MKVRLQCLGKAMLRHALLRSSLHIHVLPGAAMAKCSRISERAGNFTFGGARASRALMALAYNKHLHFVPDFGLKNAAADGHAPVGLTPCNRVWLEVNMAFSCRESEARVQWDGPSFLIRYLVALRPLGTHRL